jgi:deferrochelatase/peroxidase EfeB
MSTPTPTGGISRRRVLGLLGAGAAVGIGAGAGGAAALVPTARPPRVTTTVPFFGTHQAGIATAAQDRLHFATFDLADGVTREELIGLLTTWTSAAARLTAGEEVGTGAVSGPLTAPPADTGEAQGLHAAKLTLTVGFGTSLFDHRYGLAAQRPARMLDLPAFAGDALDPGRSGGDLCLQACSDDPQVAVHAIRNLARLARGLASVRYSQLGFGRTSSTSSSQATPRNMMGFKDGTANLTSEDRTAMDTDVWAQSADGPAWLAGGSYLVSRRIRMLIEPWDSTPLDEQQRVMGRLKGTGAPFGKADEFDELDLTSKDLDQKAHVRLAHPTSNGGAVLLRRGYSFVDGTDAYGRLDAGLFFLAYMRDPKQFVTIQTTLAGTTNDALNEYIQHVGSGLFACPPGVQPGGYWGQALMS